LNVIERYSVLVVDDDASFLTSIQRVLSDEVEVTTATSADEALELVKDHRFHVVLSDLAMPGMDGKALLRRIGQMPYPVSCLLLTGSDEFDRSKDGEHQYVLLKPFDPARLVTLVLQLARVAQMRRSVENMDTSFERKRR